MRFLAYLSHPIGIGNGGDLVHRQDNIANAAAWLRFLVQHTRWAICVPWYPYIVALDGETHKPRGLVDNITVLERCDVLVQVGGQISTHMEFECEQALGRRIPVVNLTDFGFTPPWNTPTPEITKILADRAAAALAAVPRVPWMPQLTSDEQVAVKAMMTETREVGGVLHDLMSRLLSANAARS